MQELEQILFNGFTVYVSNYNGKPVGLGLKYIGEKGMDAVELIDIDHIMESFPRINEQLKEENILQIYMAFNHTYVSSLGKTIKEGEYGEIDAFEVIQESASYTPQDTLIGIEEKIGRLTQNENNQVKKKMYRLYGSDRYESHSIVA